MYRHKKVGDAVVVDTEQVLTTIDPSTTTLQITDFQSNTNYVYSMGSTSNLSENIGTITTTSSISLPSTKCVNFGVGLPPISRKENISVSFSGNASGYSWDNSPNDRVRIVPFVALKDTLASEEAGHMAVKNIFYLPADCYQDSTSLNTTIIIKDCGLGASLESTGLVLGYQFKNIANDPRTVYNATVSISGRYNYAPIKTLDLEV